MDTKLKEQIISLTQEYFGDFHAPVSFSSGKDYIRYSGRVFDHEEGKLLVDAALNFWLTAGKYAKRFEHKLANYLGLRKSMLTNSGSSANLLAVSALTSHKLEERRLKEGDGIITVAAGFFTTVNPIYQNNLVPVYCDVDMGTNNIKLVDQPSVY